MNPASSPVWGNHLSSGPAEQNVLFCAGRDVQTIPAADEVLLPYDIWTNQAHSIMLYEQGIIEQQTTRKILQGLHLLEELVLQGKFQLDPQKEDVHMNVESFVTERFGVDIGGRMHTGRSRNDQTTCDMRLYLRDQCLKLSENIHQLIAVLIDHARHHAGSVMPGFTHYQPAMVTTWGHWICSYIQALLRDSKRCEMAFDLLNANPLGAAASFGTSWPINRQRTTELLGFDEIELNTLDCVTSRWENEAQLAHTYVTLMNHLSIVSQDLIFLSLPYTKMVEIHESLVTGSSIMPQKKNPDFAEVIRSKASLSQGLLIGLLGIQKGGLSGYNRDTQMTKYMIMDIVRECEFAPLILTSVFSTLKVQTEQMKNHCYKNFINAADVADYLALEGHFSFREGYHLTASAVRYATEAHKESIDYDSLAKALTETKCLDFFMDDHLAQLNDPHFLVEQRQHAGAPSAKRIEEQLQLFEKKLTQSQSHFNLYRQQLQSAKKECSTYTA